MDLRKAMSAIGRRWYLVLVGIILGCCLAWLGMFHVSLPGANGPNSRLEITPRSFKTYRVVQAVVIDAPEAGLGRTDTPIDKPIELAPTYAYMATDDTVMRALESKFGSPLRAEIVAVPVDGSPIVQLSVEGSDPDYIAKVAAVAQEAFIAELEAYQERNKIPSGFRIAVRPLGPASAPKLLMSRQYEVLAVLFLLPVVAFVGLALLMENWSRESAGPARESGSAEPTGEPSTEAPQPTAPSSTRQHQRTG